MSSRLHHFAQKGKYLIPLLAAPAALLLSQGQAKAVLVYNIFESAPNVIMQTSGSLNLTGAQQTKDPNQCYANGAIISEVAAICTGIDKQSPGYKITGPAFFNGTVDTFSSVTSSSVSGISTVLGGAFQSIFLDANYISNTPIISSATLNGKTLSSLGFTISSGLLGSWTLNGTNETIYACLGPASCVPAPAQSVPGPLPLLGATAAFGWSRRLRKRIASPLL